MPGRTVSSALRRTAIGVVVCAGGSPDDGAGIGVCAQEANNADAARALSISGVNLARTGGICALYVLRCRTRTWTRALAPPTIPGLMRGTRRWVADNAVGSPTRPLSIHSHDSPVRPAAGGAAGGVAGIVTVTN